MSKALNPNPLITGTEASLIGSSAPLLTNPFLTDILSNIPIWPHVDQPVTNISQTTAPDDPQPTTSHPFECPRASIHRIDERKRKHRGRLPANAAATIGQPKRNRLGGIRKRGRRRGRPPNRPLPTVQQAQSSTSDSETSDSSAYVTTNQETSAPPFNSHYLLRSDGVHAIFVEGTCGLRDCTCNHLI